MAKRKFYILTTTGLQIEIDELDFNNLKGRVGRGQTNGWYAQRGKAMGDIADWRLQVKDMAAVFSNQPDPGEKERKGVDVTKRELPEVGAKDEPVVEPPKCLHNFADENDYQYVTQIVNGINRYYKQCVTCGAKSTLIKKREVEVALEAKGASINDVELVQ